MAEMTDEELNALVKPCPFCGSIAHMRRVAYIQCNGRRPRPHEGGRGMTDEELKALVDVASEIARTWAFPPKIQLKLDAALKGASNE